VVSPLMVLYMQIADGKGEHCTFQIPRLEVSGEEFHRLSE